MSPDQIVAIAGTGSAVLAVWVGWFWKIRPKVRSFWVKVMAALDTFAGRDPITDEATGSVFPAILPLHRRLAHIERTQEDFAATLRSIAEVQASQNELQRTVTDHEARLLSLEDVEAERSLTREESAAMWRAMDHKDVIDVTPEEET